MQRFILSCLAIMGLSVMLQADPWNKKTELTVNETIQVPGATLTPGKYVVKLVDSQSNRHIVQFTNEAEDRVISTVLAIPNQRLQPTGDSEFTFYEGNVGGAPALQAWFYPGDNFGQQFAYPKQKAMELSQASGQEVPSLTEEDTLSSETTETETRESASVTESATTPPPAPARTRPAASERQPDPTTLAQAQPQQQPSPQPERQAAPAPQPSAQEEPSELPATASPAPLLGLMGLLSLAGALGLRRLSNRKPGASS